MKRYTGRYGADQGNVENQDRPVRYRETGPEFGKVFPGVSIDPVKAGEIRMALLEEYPVLWGRQERKEFAFELVPVVLPLALLYGFTPEGELPPLWLASGLWLLATALVAVLAVRRLHDVGRSGWYALLLLLLPCLNALVLLALLLLPGQPGATRRRATNRLQAIG